LRTSLLRADRRDERDLVLGTAPAFAAGVLAAQIGVIDF